MLRRLGAALSVIGIAAVLPGSAVAATTYPASDGSAGPCNLSGPIDTTTGSGLPVAGTSVIPPSGGSPGIRVVNCTTITETGTVVVSGSNALDLRATGAVSIQGILDGSGQGGSSGGLGGPGGGSGQTGTSSMVTGGPGVGDRGESGDGVRQPTGGAPGMAYGGGVSGVIGSSASNSTDGAGGGGAGSGELSGALASFALARGSGGGAGGLPEPPRPEARAEAAVARFASSRPTRSRSGPSSEIRAKGGDGMIGGGSSGQLGWQRRGRLRRRDRPDRSDCERGPERPPECQSWLGGTGGGPPGGGNGAVGSIHTLANVFSVFKAPQAQKRRRPTATRSTRPCSGPAAVRSPAARRASTVRRTAVSPMTQGRP